MSILYEKCDIHQTCTNSTNNPQSCNKLMTLASDSIYIHLYIKVVVHFDMFWYLQIMTNYATIICSYNVISRVDLKNYLQTSKGLYHYLICS